MYCYREKKSTPPGRQHTETNNAIKITKQKKTQLKQNCNKVN